MQYERVSNDLQHVELSSLQILYQIKYVEIYVKLFFFDTVPLYQVQ